jgi:transcription elongation factor Elf1
MDIEFKEITFQCNNCGNKQKIVTLTENNYGFETANCSKCGKRNKIEYFNYIVKSKIL